MRLILARTDAQKANGQAKARQTGKASGGRLIDSRTLFASNSEVLIALGTETYRLRLTRLNNDPHEIGTLCTSVCLGPQCCVTERDLDGAIAAGCGSPRQLRAREAQGRVTRTAF